MVKWNPLLADACLGLEVMRQDLENQGREIPLSLPHGMEMQPLADSGLAGGLSEVRAGGSGLTNFLAKLGL